MLARVIAGQASTAAMSSAVSVVSCSSLGIGERREALRLVGDRGFEQVAHEAGVAEAASARLGGDEVADPGQSVVGARVAAPLAEPEEDGDQLVVGVVGKRDRAGEAALQPGVGVDEVGHLGGVAGGDDGQIVAVVLHELHQRVDGLAPEVVVAAACQGVRLVDQQHPAQRGLRASPAS